MRIGITTGEVIVGHIGSERRVDYTAVGSTVNLAARLQTLAETGDILVARPVYEAIAGQVEAEDAGLVQVRGFDEQRWADRRFDLVVAGNLAKFSQHEELGDYLVGTGSRVLVEASPYDRIWGIGLAADDEHSTSPEHWPGLNLLGFALMEVRQQLLDNRRVVS